MKRILSVLLALALCIGLAACGGSAKKWQEAYDLGVKYLAEGNYEEAVIQFAAAIEIDPKRPEAYIGRGDAHAAAQNLAAAAEDYRHAATLENAGADPWHKLADVLTQQGENDAAEQALRQAIDSGAATADTYIKLADLLYAKGDRWGALAVLQQGAAATGDAALADRAAALEVEIATLPPKFSEMFCERVTYSMDVRPLEEYFIPEKDFPYDFSDVIAAGVSGDVQALLAAVQGSAAVQQIFADTTDTFYECWTMWSDAYLTASTTVNDNGTKAFRFTYRPAAGTGFLFYASNAGSVEYTYALGTTEGYLFNGSYTLTRWHQGGGNLSTWETTGTVSNEYRNGIQEEVYRWNIIEGPQAGYVGGHTKYDNYVDGFLTPNPEWVDANGQACSTKSISYDEVFPQYNGQIVYNNSTNKKPETIK